MASSQTNFISREEYRAKKALDEARKAGKVPAELDEEGREINPHMPQYIIQAPWYLNQDKPSLKHHRFKEEKQSTSMDVWYPRGIKKADVATKYRKGACENCGAMTHIKKDCFEKPRKVGAKFSGKDIVGDDLIKEIDLDYEQKDPNMYQEIVKEYEFYENERKLKKQQELDEGAVENQFDEELKQHDFDNDAPVANKDPKIKTTIRNLRIREDTAKYLLNLDVYSAYYDPKSRSMRENPNEYSNDNEKRQIFKGDNCVRFSGDTAKILQQEKFAWETVERKQADLNTIGLPTGTEHLYKKLKEQQDQENLIRNTDLLKSYGGEEYLGSRIDIGQTETYVEWTCDGKILNKKTNASTKSRYEEDVFPNNHMAVWGSWWNEELGWGYGCCFSDERHSNCLGEKGKKMALLKEFKIKKMKEDELKKINEELIKEADPNEENEDENMNISNENNYMLKEKDHENVAVKNATPKKVIKSAKKKISKYILILIFIESSSEEDSDESSSSSESSSGDSSSEDSEKEKKTKKIKKIKKDKKLDKKNVDKKKNSVDKKLKNALKKEKLKEKEEKDERNRKYNSLANNLEKITEEEIEAYRLNKKKFDDPLA